jgi:hypothetical protein
MMMVKTYADHEEEQKWKTLEEYDSYYKLNGRNAPSWLQGENLNHYDRRLLAGLQSYTSNSQNIDVHEAWGSAFPVIKNKILEEVKREVAQPSNIPDGTLKEVTRFDQSGRPYSLFFGKPNSWMRQFMPDRVARVAKIRNVDEERGRFTKVG